MNEEERIELKHLNIKCPVCGNTDFIRIKKVSSGWLSWDVESETEVYGCTKCYYLMHFCETAVLQMMGIQDDREKIQNEINVLIHFTILIISSLVKALSDDTSKKVEKCKLVFIY